MCLHIKWGRGTAYKVTSGEKKKSLAVSAPSHSLTPSRDTQNLPEPQIPDYAAEHVSAHPEIWMEVTAICGTRQLTRSVAPREGHTLLPAVLCCARISVFLDTGEGT